MKSKIQLPWVEDNLKAEEKRLKKACEYWNLSKAWNGQAPITIMHAINQANKILEGLNPNCNVYKQTEKLLQDLIDHGSKSAQMRAWKKANPVPKGAKMIIM